VWYNKFKDSRTALNDDPEKHRSRPWTSYSEEDCVIVEALIREGRKVKVREIALQNNSCAILHIPWKGTLP
jgi:hypothetical protein